MSYLPINLEGIAGPAIIANTLDEMRASYYEGQVASVDFPGRLAVRCYFCPRGPDKLRFMLTVIGYKDEISRLLYETYVATAKEAAKMLGDLSWFYSPPKALEALDDE